MPEYDEMPEYAEAIKIELKKRDILLMKNVLGEICYGANPMLDVEFSTLLGFNKEYVEKFCAFLKNFMDENDISE